MYTVMPIKELVPLLQEADTVATSPSRVPKQTLGPGKTMAFARQHSPWKSTTLVAFYQGTILCYGYENPASLSFENQCLLNALRAPDDKTKPKRKLQPSVFTPYGPFTPEPRPFPLSTIEEESESEREEGKGSELAF